MLTTEEKYFFQFKTSMDAAKAIVLPVNEGVPYMLSNLENFCTQKYGYKRKNENKCNDAYFSEGYCTKSILTESSKKKKINIYKKAYETSLTSFILNSEKQRLLKKLKSKKNIR